MPFSSDFPVPEHDQTVIFIHKIRDAEQVFIPLPEAFGILPDWQRFLPKPA